MILKQTIKWGNRENCELRVPPKESTPALLSGTTPELSLISVELAGSFSFVFLLSHCFASAYFEAGYGVPFERHDCGKAL